MEQAQSEGGGKRIPWQIIVAAIIVVIYLGVSFSLYAKLQHVPSPYYGGDLYAHHGFALNYIANGFWTDPYFINEFAFYPWLGNYLFIALSVLPGLTMMKAEIFVGLLTTILSAIAFYFLGWQLFKSHTWSLVFLLFSIASRGIPDGSPNLVPWMITIPAWFAFWLRAEETHKLRDKMLAGLFMGLTSLAHVAYFLAGMAVFAFTILVETLRQKNKKEAVLASLKLYGPMLAIGFVVALPFYGPIILNYHGKTLNPLFQYNGPDIDSMGIGWMMSTLYRYSFDFASWQMTVLSLLTMLGLVVCLMNWNKKIPQYALMWYVAGFLAPMHHLVTRPLLGKWVLPSHLWGIMIALMVFAVYGVRTVAQFADKKWPHANAQRIVLVGVVLLLAAFFMMRYNEYNANPWVKFGERLEPTTKAWLELGAWLQKNTGPNAVVLTHDEVCFAMNGFSGRKCVFVRRTHANYFVDVEQRYADGVVLLYGNNSALTNKLVNTYDVDYVLIDAHMMQNPVLVDARFESYLKENNVTFTKIRARKDPATPNARVFDMLSVSLQPLNKALESRLSEATTVSINNQQFLRLFKLNP